MTFFWKKRKSVRYIEFDKSKETKVMSEHKFLEVLAVTYRTVSHDFRDKVKTYVLGRFPVMVDFDEETIETVTSDIIIDNGVDKKGGSIHEKLEGYLKKVGRNYTGNVV